MVAHFLEGKGEEGKMMFESLNTMGLAQEVQWHDGVTRTRTTRLEDSGRITEIIEPSDAIPLKDVDSLTSRLMPAEQSCACVALCGGDFLCFLLATIVHLSSPS